MDKDLKDRWVTALRSGDYVQGQGSLRVEDADGAVSYCCLGVLCRVAQQELVEAGLTVKVNDRGRLTVDGATGTLTDAVADLFGMPNGTGALNDMPTDEKGRRPELTSLNDNGSTFDQLADLIEYAL